MTISLDSVGEQPSEEGARLGPQLRPPRLFAIRLLDVTCQPMVPLDWAVALISMIALDGMPGHTSRGLQEIAGIPLRNL